MTWVETTVLGLNISGSEVHEMGIYSTDSPNTSEGLSSSSSLPPLLVSYVANPPSEFLMLRSYKKMMTHGGKAEILLDVSNNSVCEGMWFQFELV